MSCPRWYVPGIFTLAAVLLVLFILFAGCSGSVPSPPGSVPVSPVSGSPDPLSWKQYPLTDLLGKDNFSVNQFAGKPVLVAVQSVACPSCIVLLVRQLAEIDKLTGGREGTIVVVSLDLEPAGDPGFIASYHDQFNFTGYSAHSPDDLTFDLFHTFGPFAVDPATVPVILVCPNGRDLLLPTGVKTAEMLNATLTKEC